MSESTKEESHEDFMKRCFGEDFWDKPEDERFMMAIKRVLAYNPHEAKKKEARERKRATLPGRNERRN